MALAVEAVFGAFAMESTAPAQVDRWLTASIFAKALLPSLWTGFTVAYCRADAGSVLRRLRNPLLLSLGIPLGIAVVFRQGLVEVSYSESARQWAFDLSIWARGLMVFLMIACLLALANLERTYRAAMGVERWKIKFVLIGLGIVLGIRIYTLSQGLIYSDFSAANVAIESFALLLGCLFMFVANVRTNFEELELYPSNAFLKGSLVGILAASYLIIVGILAQVVKPLGITESFPIHTIVVLLGVSGLAVLLLSDRFRVALQRFVERNFRNPKYRVDEVWGKVTALNTAASGRRDLSRHAAIFISETFDALTVSILVAENGKGQLRCLASTSHQEKRAANEHMEADIGVADVALLMEERGLLNLGERSDPWVVELRRLLPRQFPEGEDYAGLPLVVGNQFLGLIVITDRVSGVSYSLEEQDLLACIADQIASSLRSYDLTEGLMKARELEAFQTISTFFVHDLKNAANSLSLMLQNFSTHYDDPEFRKDALRGFSKTAERINALTMKLGTLKDRVSINPRWTNLNQLVNEALENLSSEMEGVEVVRKEDLLPDLLVDAEQIRSVITNLCINAREAMREGGRMEVQTRSRNGKAVLTVKDSGCGMAPDFVSESLFQPFRSTKAEGLGIGVFQSQLIVEAHGGSIQVESVPDKGSIFHVFLPLGAAREK